MNTFHLISACFILLGLFSACKKDKSSGPSGSSGSGSNCRVETAKKANDTLITRWEYNSEGKLIKETYYQNYNEVSGYKTFEYTSSTATEKEYRSDGSLREYRVNYLDGQNRVIKVGIFTFAIYPKKE